MRVPVKVSQTRSRSFDFAVLEIFTQEKMILKDVFRTAARAKNILNIPSEAASKPMRKSDGHRRDAGDERPGKIVPEAKKAEDGERRERIGRQGQADLPEYLEAPCGKQSGAFLF